MTSITSLYNYFILKNCKILEWVEKIKLPKLLLDWATFSLCNMPAVVSLKGNDYIGFTVELL
jgi:hypothetical protein